MDQKRLFSAIAISAVILIAFQLLLPAKKPAPPAPQQTVAASSTAAPAAAPGGGGATATASALSTPRVPFDAAKVRGSVNLRGARLDDLVLKDYHETIARNSPNVQLLSPAVGDHGYFVQFGWSAAPGTKIALPNSTTLWTSQGGTLAPAHPLTLSWANGQGLTFRVTLSIDDNYMLTVNQQVQNAGTAPVSLFPWARVQRDYTPQVAGTYLIHEGPIGVFNGRVDEIGYKATISDGNSHDGTAYTATGPGGWAGITDQYWLAAVVPNQTQVVTGTYRGSIVDGHDQYQVDYVTATAEQVAPGGSASYESHVFAGAKVVSLLDSYERELHIPSFDKAVDFGYFYFLTKPIFFALDWLNTLLGNFGLAILAFTLFVKALFFPLAAKSYKSMSKMKLLGPKIQAMRERYKDEPAKIQSEMMKIYKAEKVNPASGCLPMIIQIPVFFSLYKDLYVTIEMRHAPFFGWIRDLSAPDPTNVFNLFGLIPFDPTTISPFLHVGIWPLIMGGTMYLQQRLNPPPPDPAQARIFQLMPVIFTFMLARFPAGLVIYYSWNNTLTVIQQWFIMRNTRLAKSPRMART